MSANLHPVELVHQLIPIALQSNPEPLKRGGQDVELTGLDFLHGPWIDADKFGERLLR